MLPVDVEPRSFLGRDALSFSETSTLASCEQRWALTYGKPDRERTPSTKAQLLGTEVHRLWGHLYTGNIAQSEDPTAQWMMARYATYYARDLREGRIMGVQAEIPMAAKLPRGPWFFGFGDLLGDVESPGEVPDGLYVVECKTTADMDATLWLSESLQMKLYVWALRQMGYPVVGAMLDVLGTSGRDKQESLADAYKRLRQELKDQGIKEPAAVTKERAREDRLSVELPLEESFDRRWLLYSDAEIADAVHQARRAVEIRRDLTRCPQRPACRDCSAPLRNAGPACARCPVVGECFDLEIELAEDPNKGAT